MKRTITLCLTLLLVFQHISLFSQSGGRFRVIPSNSSFHFGDFYLTGNGPGQIIINPANPMSSTYYGVEFYDKSTIQPYTFQLEKLHNGRTTIIYQMQTPSWVLSSIGYRPSDVDLDGGWGYNISVPANSQELAVEAPMSVQMGVSGSNTYITFGPGRGVITFKIGATLNIPANSPGKGLIYKKWGTYLFTFWVHHEVIN